MSINKALIAVFSILSLFVVVTIFNLNYSKITSLPANEYIDDEALITSVVCVPEIVRSYDRVKEVYGRKNILFFRYIIYSCSSCLDSQLNELLSFQEEIGKEYVWVFPAYPDDRNSRIRLSADLAKFNYLNIPTDSLLIPMHEREQKSYFAWIDSEGTMDMVFVPDRSNVHQTRQFFLEVKKRLQTLGEN